MPNMQTSMDSIFYAQRGQGEPALVCIHGAGGTHLHWGLQLHALSDTVRTITLDLPGHGRSPGAGCDSIRAYSNALVAALNALELEHVIVAGHSMGGAVALWTALNAPERVAALALISTGARLPVMPALFGYLQQGNQVAAVNLIVEHAYGTHAAPELQARGQAAFMQTNPHVLHNDLTACAGYNVMDQLHQVCCPTLIVCGDEDRITPLKFSHYLHKEITTSTLVTVSGAGHMVLLEQPDAVSTALRQCIVTCQYKKS